MMQLSAVYRDDEKDEIVLLDNKGPNGKAHYPVPRTGDFFVYNGQRYRVDRVIWDLDDLEVNIALRHLPVRRSDRVPL